MSKIAVVGDIHFGYKNNSDFYLTSIERFVDLVLIPQCNKHGVNELVLLGDIFDSRTNINVKTLFVATHIMKKLSTAFFKINIVVGNHDLYYTNNNDVDSLCIFNNLDNVFIHRKPTTISNESYVPWINSNEDYKGTDTNIVFGHFDIFGFNMNATTVSEHGIDPDAFASNKLVISGHFHNRSTKRIGNTNFVYIGSPYQLNRGDAGEDRGFIILDVSSLEYEFIINDVSPVFIKLEFPNKFKSSCINNNFIDVYVKCENDIYNENKLVKYLDVINELNPLTVETHFINEHVEDEEFELTIENMSTTPNLMKDYVYTKYKDGNRVDELYEMLMNVYEKIRSND